MSEERTGPVTISLSGVLADLENGITRKEGDKGYNPELGSIQEKYSITKSDVDELFKHPALKGKKVKTPKKVSFVIVDDREVAYGSPSKAGEARLAKNIAETPEAEVETDGEMLNADESPVINTEENNDSIEATIQQVEESTVDSQF